MKEDKASADAHKDEKKVQPKEPVHQDPPAAGPQTPDERMAYAEQVQATRPDFASSDPRLESFETAAQKRLRSEEVALELQQKSVAAVSERMQQRLAQRQAAHEAIPGILKDIDAAVNEAVDAGARSLHFHVPVESIEDAEALSVKVNGLISALTALGYNVMQHVRHGVVDPIVPPPASGDVVPEDADEDEPGYDLVEANGSVTRRTISPSLVISW